VEQQLARGAHLNHITRHILGLYQGVAGARQFRRYLSENAYKNTAGVEVLIEAAGRVQTAAGRQGN
jgi:tRNA-dihydrouridine synthase A